MCCSRSEIPGRASLLSNWTRSSSAFTAYRAGTEDQVSDWQSPRRLSNCMAGGCGPRASAVLVRYSTSRSQPPSTGGKMTFKLLIADDVHDIAEVIAFAVRLDWPECIVRIATDGQEALRCFAQ